MGGCGGRARGPRAGFKRIVCIVISTRTLFRKSLSFRGRAEFPWERPSNRPIRSTDPIANGGRSVSASGKITRPRRLPLRLYRWYRSAQAIPKYIELFIDTPYRKRINESADLTLKGTRGEYEIYSNPALAELRRTFLEQPRRFHSRDVSRSSRQTPSVVFLEASVRTYVYRYTAYRYIRNRLVYLSCMRTANAIR